MRLIDADELKNVLEGYSDIDDPNPHFPLDMVEKDIDDAPTVEAKEVVHGEWVKCDGVLEHFYKCSRCGDYCDFKVNFCPNCGADMRTSAE